MRGRPTTTRERTNDAGWRLGVSREAECRVVCRRRAGGREKSGGQAHGAEHPGRNAGGRPGAAQAGS